MHLILLTMLASGCVSAASSPAVCDATQVLRKDHASALAKDGGDNSVITGARLIAALDAGCKEAK